MTVQSISSSHKFTTTVEPQYSGHSLKQPPHFYNHLAQVPSDTIVYICTSVRQPPLYYSHKLWPTGDRYNEVPLYCTRLAMLAHGDPTVTVVKDDLHKGRHHSWSSTLLTH